MTYRAYRPADFRPEKLERIRRAAAVIAEYEQRGFVMSLRQVYYQLVSRGVIPNEVRAYSQLGDDVVDGRMAGLISWEAIEDRGRNLQGNRTWDGPGAALQEAREGYRADKWAPQPVRPEVWVEKAALEGVVGDICSRLDVNFFCCRGYNSASEQWRAGQRLAAYIRRGQRPIVIHLGDHDPSGIDMTRDNSERLSLFAGVPIQVIRVALNMDQVRRYSPPPNPAKVTDSRYEGYLREYGDSSWEVDALRPEVLQDIIRSAVLQFRDERLWEEALDEENVDRQRIAELIEDNFGGKDDH